LLHVIVQSMSRTPPRQHVNADSSRRPGTPWLGSPRLLITLLIVLVAVSTIVAIQVTDFPSTSSDEDSTPEVLARTGCLDLTISDADHAPPVSLNQAEAATREQLSGVDSLDSSAESSQDEIELGDLVWAEYGELGPGESGREYSGHAWVLIFDDGRHESWWDRLTNQRENHRFSALFRPDTGQVGSVCGGQTS
jgi:hypothetical protein